MRYKFTEIKGIKRIKKSFTCMNVCDIQYPRLDEDFVTTDTDQTVRGRKTFYDKVTFSEADFDGRLTVNNYLDAQSVSAPTFNLTAGIEAPGPGTISLLTVGHGIYNNTDDVFVRTSPGSLSITSAGDLTLESSSKDKKIYIGSDVVPLNDNTYTLGGEDNRWSTVWANEVNCDGGFITAEVLEAGNHAQFTFEGFVKALQAANIVPTNGTFQFLTVLATRVSTGETITGGNNVKTLNIIASPSTSMSLSIQSSDTTSDQKWVAVTGGFARSVTTPTEWIFVLAVRIPQ